MVLTHAPVHSQLQLRSLTAIAQHQDQIVAFNEYLTLELIDDLPNKNNPVINFNASKAGINHLAHNLSANLIAQLILLCGPPLFALINGCPDSLSSISSKELYGTLGTVFAILTIGRIWFSRNFRNRVMSKLDSRLAQNERIAVAAAAQASDIKQNEATSLDSHAEPHKSSSAKA